MGSKDLTVDITPHGVGDAVLHVQTKSTKGDTSTNSSAVAAAGAALPPSPPGQNTEAMFVKPLEQRMKMQEFFKVPPLALTTLNEPTNVARTFPRCFLSRMDSTYVPPSPVLSATENAMSTPQTRRAAPASRT